ncbi:MAG: hypothetical protein FWC41_00105 [Firmicutes bacterium]|nr:hypothetical protein [Bacillota bacterium]
MNIKLLKKLLIISPIVVLITMLFLINHTVNYFVETEYDFVFEGNKKSIQTFSREIEMLDEQFRRDIIEVCIKTLVDKYSVYGFLVEADSTIYYSNDDSNREYISKTLSDIDKQSLISQENQILNIGDLVLSGQKWYCHTIASGGDSHYYIFMTVDKDLIREALNTWQVTVPISIIGLLLWISVHDSIWQRMVRHNERYKRD